ncbi:hypothetical protein [Mesorhizobium sp.]|uniref:hypothetical protein n=1 Tax=Mesorhizobium sp. TaxID=1871066 RepID=UPI0025F405C6|nr:hypothetical protein [Mesorhizobium sp.]
MNLPLSRCPGTINRPLSLVIGGVAPEARAGEFEERVDYLLGPAGFRCALSQFLEGRFQGELALKAAVRMVD